MACEEHRPIRIGALIELPSHAESVVASAAQKERGRTAVSRSCWASPARRKAGDAGSIRPRTSLNRQEAGEPLHLPPEQPGDDGA